MAKKFSGKTVMAAILDRSGSMGPLINDMLGGYNEWLAAQKKLEGEATLTTTIFDTIFDVIGPPNMPVALVSPLTKTRYFARGGTALNDAIGQTVSAMEVGKKDRGLVLIVTDGQENSSKEWSTPQIKALIAEKEALGNWTFAYLSAAPTGFADAASYKMHGGNTIVMAASSAGVNKSWVNLRESTQSYRNGIRGQSMSFLHDNDEDALITE